MISEVDLSTLDRFIREVVRRLNAAGFNTTDSGDGWSKVGGELDHGNEVLPCPHVHMPMKTVHSGVVAARKLRDVVSSWGIELSSGMVQLTYDPVDGSAILSLFHVSDEMLCCQDVRTAPDA